MLKKPTKKLSIHTETVRKLADAELPQVKGGAATSFCYPSQYCSLHFTGCCPQ